MSRKFLPIVLLSLFFPFAAGAQTLPLSRAEVEQALNEADGRLQQLLDRELKGLFERLDLSVDDGQPVFHFTEQDVVLQEGCDSRSVLEQVEGTITLRDSSRAALRVVSFAEPLSLRFSLNADLLSTGRIAQEWGIGNERHCARYADYDFDFDATGNLLVTFEVTVTPRIEYLEEGIKYTPIPSVHARIEHSSYRVDVDDKAFASLIRKKIDRLIQPYLEPAAAEQFSLRLEQQFRQAILDAWGAEYVILRMPELDRQRLEEMVADLEQRLEDEAFDPDDYLGEIYYLLLSGNGDLWDTLLNDTVLCQQADKLMARMPVEPLYRREGDACVAVDPQKASAGSYYADLSCRQVVDYSPVDLKSYCAALNGSEDPSADLLLAGGVSPWSLSPATRLDIGVEPVGGNHQPFTARTIYKRAGECALEMRIYRRNLAATDLDPLLMLHGGSWERRRNSLLGMESQISHYTEQGFVVFVPTYRLVGDTEGGPACNGVEGEQIVEDVTDALAWVRSHGAEYGAKPGPVALFGQSAGGHLALRLAIRQPDAISRLLLLYPATDFGDFLTRWRSGELGEEPEGLAALEGFIGRPAAEVRADDPVIERNSLPAIVAAQPERYPPMFIVHGSGDSLVPVSQSVRLCNALAGDPEQGPVESVPLRIAEGRGRSYACDRRGSQLHVVTGAGHMLDGCLFSLLCPAGGLESQAVARGFLQAGRHWLKETGASRVTPPVAEGRWR